MSALSIVERFGALVSNPDALYGDKEAYQKIGAFVCDNWTEIAKLLEAADTIEELLEALRVFSDALGVVADTDTVRWPGNETIEHSGAAEEITWGDLRRARDLIRKASPISGEGA